MKRNGKRLEVAAGWLSLVARGTRLPCTAVAAALRCSPRTARNALESLLAAGIVDAGDWRIIDTGRAADLLRAAGDAR